MSDWPSVQIATPDGTISLGQVDESTVNCWISKAGNNAIYLLTNCTASADCLTLAAQTKWLFFTVNVSVVLQAGWTGDFSQQVADAVDHVPPDKWTVAINADGTTVHPISQQAFADAVAFVKACKLPAIPQGFKLGRVP